MAIITPASRVIVAQLTARGREILFSQNERFIISQFAPGDSEINYHLVNSSDPNSTDIESLAVFEGTENPTSNTQSLLIRYSNNLEDIVAQQQNTLVPNSEVSVVIQQQGSAALSLQNWNNDATIISFALYDPSTQAYFLSNAFNIDFSDFWNKYNIYFDFVPINPVGSLQANTNYWFINNTIEDNSGNLLPITIGIDNKHKPINGVTVSNILNTLDIPILSFEISLPSNLVQTIYNYLVKNTLSSITANVVITNQDTTIVPITNFYGPNPSYQNISISLPITLTF